MMNAQDIIPMPCTTTMQLIKLCNSHFKGGCSPAPQKKKKKKYMFNSFPACKWTLGYLGKLAADWTRVQAATPARQEKWPPNY